MADERPRVPALALGALPLVPGFRSHQDVPRGLPYYGKRTIACSERVESARAPAPNVVQHTYDRYSARPAPPADRPLRGPGGGVQSARIPAAPCTPRGGRHVGHSRPLHRAKWLQHDREVLRFFMYFKEAVHECPTENWRARKVVLNFFRADDSIQIHEPKESNSGLAQGEFLKRVPIGSLAGPGGKHTLELCDLVVGAEVPIFGRVFRIVDADAKTRKFFREQLQLDLAPAEPYPVDPIQQRQAMALELSQQAQARTAKGRSKLGNFLKYGDRALEFEAHWDDTSSLFGDRRRFKLEFFLADGTVQIRENYSANCGRELFPKFLSRSKVVRPDGTPFELADFTCGNTVTIMSRDFLLVACDDFTKAYCAERGIVQTKVEVAPETKVAVRRPVNTSESELAAGGPLGATLGRMPRPQRADIERQKKYEDKMLHIRIELVTSVPQEIGRRFDLAYQLSDQSLALFEPVQRNTGIQGGKFLERGIYQSAVTGVAIHEDELGAALRAAVARLNHAAFSAGDDEIEILRRRFRVYNADDFTFEFFGLQRPEAQAVTNSRIDGIFKMIVHALLSRKVDIRAQFHSADVDQSRSIEADEFKNMLAKAGVTLEDEDLKLVMAKFNSGRDHIWYQDFCDALATHWSPPPRGTSSRVEQIQQVLLHKLRHANTQLRVLFRTFDIDSNGRLTMSEFKRLLQNYAIEVTDAELAALMRLYDSKATGSIDYESLCDKVYECNFASVLDEKKALVGADAVQELDLGDYLHHVTHQDQLKAATDAH